MALTILATDDMGIQTFKQVEWHTELKLPVHIPLTTIQLCNLKSEHVDVKNLRVTPGPNMVLAKLYDLYDPLSLGPP